MKLNHNNYVTLLKQGKEEALSYFIEKDGWIVKSIIHKNGLLSEEECMECMNDTFLAIWQNIGKYDENRAAFTTWLAGVSRYCLLNYLKKKSKIEYVSLDEVIIEDYEAAGEEKEEEREEFKKLLKGLSQRDQKIFMRLFWDDMNYEEVCREFHMERDVLYNRVSRGKRKLRKRMEKEVI